MRVAIASTFVPFVRGGGTMITDSLQVALQEFGHEVELIMIPWRDHWRELARQTLALRCLDLTESGGRTIDLLVTIRYPSYAICHPNKVAWFIHHFRAAYDLSGTRYDDVPDNPDGHRFRENLRRSDTRFLREARRVFVNSHIVAARLRLFNGIEPDGVLYPPLPLPGLYGPGEMGDYFLYSSRLAPIKRQALALQAMQYVRGPFTLKLVGSADFAPYARELQRAASELGVADRVEFLGWVQERDKAALTRGATGVLYIPYHEDSYGYSTLEAFHSHKPVITLKDSGGTREVVSDELNGLVVEPEPRALAEAMDRLWAEKQWAAAMGEHAFESLEAHQITWAHTVDQLVHPRPEASVET